MSMWEAALLGLIQGLTEFLPISSSGHLVLGKHVLGLTADSVTFEVFVHFGTVLSITTVYWREVLMIVREAISGSLHPLEWRQRYEDRPAFRTAVNIVVTMVPTGVAYLAFKDFLEARFSDPRFACGMLIVTGVLLLLTVLRKRPSGGIGPIKAFAIGCAQACALLPGISRSGATICTALYMDTEPERAANFSFLMLLPVVVLATIAKTGEMAQNGTSVGWPELAVGTIVSYIFGVVAIKALLNVVRRGRLQYFAIYCFFVGGLGLWFLR